MTSFMRELKTLKDAVERCQIALENYPLDEAEIKASYDLFCQIGACLGPAISMQLQRLTATEEGAGIDTGLGSDRTDEIRKLNAEIVSRLLFDLAPAIGGAFHSGKGTVCSIIKDLDNQNPPLELPKPPRKKRGAGSRPHRELRALARSYLHDIVIYEAEVCKLSEKEAFNQLLLQARNRRLGETYWRDLKQEQRKQRANYIQSVDKVKADALRNGGSHPKRQMLNELGFWELLGP